ncbi:hypothetical protein YDYSY3_05260 [Paenibacillus chitinolyticus]|uniref:helix-turn-helix domain-containing protein n=1 Tax=Paenibacillus chitinolyticus TaxID=79263 RepID=UPI0026E4D565|nr:helix-turn-helix domain-containing protein [Paenibacillus chitinolyticus]GKS09526.1 hypothetical protein YDYSY3_05260 [Paenibacillus chitinolyticus]
MKSDYFKSKLFMRYIWSYLFILLIPLAFATIFIYRSAVSNLQSEIEQSHLNQLNQTKTIIDGRVKELIEIASRISYDERLTLYKVHDPYYSREAISALDNYKATSSIIGDLFLYYHDDDKIYSSFGMSGLDVFSGKYSFHNWTQDGLQQDLNTLKFPKMRPADLVSQPTSLQQSILAYLVPITPNSPAPHGTVMYFIPESELTSLIDSILGSYRGLTYIFDNNGQVLTNNGDEESLTAGDLGALFKLPPGIHNQTLNGQSHSVVSVKSDKNGWTYVTLMPSAQFFSSVLHVRSFIILLVSIVVIVGAALALLLARMQYLPISNLVHFASSKSRSSRTSGNELERIRISLQEHSTRADLQEPYARNHALLMLLKYGQTKSLSADLLEAFDLKFDHDRHFAVVIGFDKRSHLHDSKDDWQTMIQLFAEVDFPGLAARAYSVELPQPNQLALVVGFDPAGQTPPFGQMQQIVEGIRTHLLELFDVSPVIGVGTAYTSHAHLNQSYIEACSAFESNILTVHGSVTFFEKLSNTPERSTFWIPGNVLLKLSQSLKQGSYDVSEQTLQEALKNLPAAGLSAPHLRLIHYDILTTLLKTASELGIHGLTQDVLSKLNFNSSEEFEAICLDLAGRICLQVERDRTKEEHSLMDRIVGYIDKHFMEHTLSLEVVSAEYGISPSYLSRTFKEKTGINFIQYIWQKRMNEVMHQLKTTNDPLKEIIVRVGYLDTPNFIRKFKKETGYTPGQYRTLNTPGEHA